MANVALAHPEFKRSDTAAHGNQSSWSGIDCIVTRNFVFEADTHNTNSVLSLVWFV